MSSKIMCRGESPVQVDTMVWRRSNEQATPSNRHPPSRFEPSYSIAPETVALRNQILEMEQAGRQAVEAARSKALAEGEAAGRAKASAETAPILARMVKTIEELAQMRPRLRQEAESDVVQLSLAIARRILHRELCVDPTALQALIQVALDRLARQEVYRARMHPAQAGNLRAALASRHLEFEVVEDARLECGSLIFETNRGKMDASVTAQLEEIERGLTDRVRQT